MEHPAVPRLWPGSTIVCVGTGPSLIAADLATCRGGAHVLVVNDAYRLALWADVLLAVDAKWWDWHRGAPEFQGLKYTLQRHETPWPGVVVLRATGQAGLDTDPSGLRTGGHGGYAAINLAYHLGASKIVLLGYDLCAASDGQHHYFGEHPDRTHPNYDVRRAAYASLYVALAERCVALVNASRVTTIPDVPRQSLEDALALEPACTR